MVIETLNEAFELLQKDTPLAKANAALGEDMSIDAIYDASKYLMSPTPFTQFLDSKLKTIKVTKQQCIEEGMLDPVIAYQVFAGLTHPTFNTLIRLCYGAYFTLDETQEAIELAGYKPLTNDSPRDSIIMTGLIFHKPISAINDDLYYIDPSLNLYLL